MQLPQEVLPGHIPAHMLSTKEYIFHTCRFLSLLLPLGQVCLFSSKITTKFIISQPHTFPLPEVLKEKKTNELLIFLSIKTDSGSKK